MDGRSIAVKRLLRQFYDLAKKEIEVGPRGVMKGLGMKRLDVGAEIEVEASGDEGAWCGS